MEQVIIDWDKLLFALSPLIADKNFCPLRVTKPSESEVNASIQP